MIDSAFIFISKYIEIIIVLICLMIVGYLSSFFLGNDNLIEESVEKIVETKTGVKLDLSP